MIKKLIAYLYLWLDNTYCTKHLIKKDFDHYGWSSKYECEICIAEKKLKDSKKENANFSSKRNRINKALKILKEK